LVSHSDDPLSFHVFIHIKTLTGGPPDLEEPGAPPMTGMSHADVAAANHAIADAANHHEDVNDWNKADEDSDDKTEETEDWRSFEEMLTVPVEASDDDSFPPPLPTATCTVTRLVQ